MSTETSMTTSRTKMVNIIAAAFLVVILAGLLGTRLLALGDPPAVEPGPATVPAPEVVPWQQLEVPCWGCPEARDWPVSFKTDLDLLAPLGTGEQNAAIWFDDFTKIMDDGKPGPRFEECQKAMKRRIEHPTLKQVLPADDPLLLEAEPWCDMATMKFYPDFHAITGFRTVIPNLLLQLALAKSWVARGQAATDPEAALADFRRVIRLGRLLRQEDVIIINDLVGLACIRIGTEAIYQHAVARKDPELALLASIVLGEVAPQRLLTAERTTKGNLDEHLRAGPDGTVILDLPDIRLKALIEMATSEPDRRFRGEPIVGLNLVCNLGTPEQQQQATAVLQELSRDPDPVIAGTARWGLTAELSKEELNEILSYKYK